jgi:hypothetical protein
MPAHAAGGAARLVGEPDDVGTTTSRSGSSRGGQGLRLHPGGWDQPTQPPTTAITGRDASFEPKENASGGLYRVGRGQVPREGGRAAVVAEPVVLLRPQVDAERRLLRDRHLPVWFGGGRRGGCSWR